MSKSVEEEFRAVYTNEQQAWLVYEVNHAQDNSTLLTQFNAKFNTDKTLKNIERFLVHVNEHHGARFRTLMEGAKQWSAVWYSHRVDIDNLDYPPTQVLSTPTCSVSQRAFVIVYHTRGHTVPELTKIYNDAFPAAQKSVNQIRCIISRTISNSTITKELLSFAKLFHWYDKASLTDKLSKKAILGKTAREAVTKKRAGKRKPRVRSALNLLPLNNPSLTTPGSSAWSTAPRAAPPLTAESAARIQDWISTTTPASTVTIQSFLGSDEEAYLIHFGNYVMDFEELLKKLNDEFKRNRKSSLMLSFFEKINYDPLKWDALVELCEKYKKTWYTPHAEPPLTPLLIMGSWQWRVELRAFLATWFPYCGDNEALVALFRMTFPLEAHSTINVLKEALTINKNAQLSRHLRAFAVRYKWFAFCKEALKSSMIPLSLAPLTREYTTQFQKFSGRPATAIASNLAKTARFERAFKSEPPEDKAFAIDKAVVSYLDPRGQRQLSEPID